MLWIKGPGTVICTMSLEMMVYHWDCHIVPQIGKLRHKVQSDVGLVTQPISGRALWTELSFLRMPLTLFSLILKSLGRHVRSMEFRKVKCTRKN